MHGLRRGYIALLALGSVVACGQDSPARGATGPGAASADRTENQDVDFAGGPKIAMRDDCDPNDPSWSATGGCLLRHGDVSNAEFRQELSSPLSLSVIGHQSWRNDPNYLEVQSGKDVTVTNEGGRVHTFTEVAQFGGGKIPNPALNRGLITAPECLTSTNVPPGERIRLSGLAAGNHRFECCIHPWMRALIKVHPDGEHGH